MWDMSSSDQEDFQYVKHLERQASAKRVSEVVEIFKKTGISLEEARVAWVKYMEGNK